MPNDPATDQAALLALQQGDAAALNRLIARWQRPLHSFAYRYCQNRTDAEDLVAQAFARLYQQRLRLRPDTRLSAWLFTTLTNLCHNHHRWKRRHPTVNFETGPADPESSAPRGPAQENLPAEGLTPELAMEHDESLRALRAAIDRLPHDLKVTLLLHHYDHLSYREIGEITGCSERGVETRLYRAKKQLRDLLLPHVATG
ncbi:MAG: Sigma-70 family polymerase sigma factor [Verrucomicrobiota bacterium]|nr:Sigma-70 family polymerase sigma factor [Verrucomicrobiota bacterium]